jgi:hypothetical protein
MFYCFIDRTLKACANESFIRRSLFYLPFP